MEDTSAISQSAEHLELLLEILACPLDNSIPLSAVRDAAGEIVALRSRDSEYPVVHNIPCLIPELVDSAKGDLPLWQTQQTKMWREYKDRDVIFISDSNEIGRHLGEIIARVGGGLYLDVGCGARPWPVYMGRVAPRLATTATRRQLLEYRVAYDVDGILLVDAEAGRVMHVDFHLPGRSRAVSGARLAVAVMWALGLGAAAGLVAGQWLHAPAAGDQAEAGDRE